ncbi:MAG: hypothetical protein ACKVPX_03200 [Myxococcaceae bacterium]
MFLRLILLCAACTSGLAFAQPTERLARRKVIPDNEKAAFAESAVKRMHQVLKETLSRLEEARRAKDIVKLNCVSAKLISVKGLLRVAEQANISMQEALAKNERDAAQADFDRLDIASGKVEQLQGDVQECLGQLAFQTDENLSLEVDIPPNLPVIDPTIPTVLPPPPARPPPSSPQL